MTTPVASLTAAPPPVAAGPAATAAASTPAGATSPFQTLLAATQTAADNTIDAALQTTPGIVDTATVASAATAATAATGTNTTTDATLAIPFGGLLGFVTAAITIPANAAVAQTTGQLGPVPTPVPADQATRSRAEQLVLDRQNGFLPTATAPTLAALTTVPTAAPNTGSGTTRPTDSNPNTNTALATVSTGLPVPLVPLEQSTTPAAVATSAATPATPGGGNAPIPAQAPIVTNLIPSIPVPAELSAVNPPVAEPTATVPASALPAAQLGDRPATAGERFAADAAAGARLVAPQQTQSVDFANALQQELAAPSAVAPSAVAPNGVTPSLVTPSAVAPNAAAPQVTASLAAAPDVIAPQLAVMPVTPVAPSAAPAAPPTAPVAPPVAPVVPPTAPVESPPAVSVPPLAAVANAALTNRLAVLNPAAPNPAAVNVPLLAASDAPVAIPVAVVAVQPTGTNEALNLTGAVSATSEFASLVLNSGRTTATSAFQPVEAAGRKSESRTTDDVPTGAAGALAAPMPVSDAPQLATVAPLTAATAPTPAAQIAETVVSQAHVLERDGGVEIRMRLDPPDLGRVQVRLLTRGDEVHGQVLVANDAVRGMLESQLPELRQRLEAAGVNVQQFSVSTDPGTGGGRNPYRDAVPEFAPRLAVSTGPTLAPLARISQPATGSLDVTV
jgi:flagellar hook-length control protein FliK